MSERIRARDLGIVIGDLPTGRHNAITDVPGVRVGHATLHREPAEGVTAIHTGVTVIEPRPEIWGLRCTPGRTGSTATAR